jgi:hypothetical protein
MVSAFLGAFQGRRRESVRASPLAIHSQAPYIKLIGGADPTCNLRGIRKRKSLTRSGDVPTNDGMSKFWREIEPKYELKSMLSRRYEVKGLGTPFRCAHARVGVSTLAVQD